MNESFLHYLWQFQYFDKTKLTTSNGESVTIFKQGILNSDAGPDFSQAKIKIGTIEWAGNVELHLKSSGWHEHGHSENAAYENVILHVVWQNDKPVIRKDGTFLPTIELKGRVNESLISGYKKLINSSAKIACEKFLPNINEITRLSMLDRALTDRLEAKSIFIRELLDKNNYDWEETTYQVIAKNFGFKVNADPFLQLSQRLPYKILLKHSNNLFQIEALLFGVAGFLDFELKDDYFLSLRKEFKVLESKYKLNQKKINHAQWKFLRLRPANFPTLRIAQFASLIVRSRNIFSKIIEASSYSELIKIFDVGQSAYWTIHYRFGKKSASVISSLGVTSVDNLIINSVTPIVAAYGIEHNDTGYIEKILKILAQMPAENNKITRHWSDLNWKVKTAFDSQALIELNNNYCQKRNCLNCSIGTALLKPAKAV